MAQPRISLDLLRSNLATTEHIKLLMNIGGPWDVCTGEYLMGHNGRWVLNGGIPNAGGFAIVGPGNSFKSTLLHCMQLSLLNNTMPVCPSTIDTYDTEHNIQQHHLMKFTKNFRNLKDLHVFREGMWNVTDSTKVKGEGFYKGLTDLIIQKKKIKGKLLVTTPHLDAAGTAPYKRMMTSQFAIDSFTDFETSASEKVLDKLSIDDVKANMVPMHKGLIKDRILNNLPEKLIGGSIYMGFTAHVGKNKQDIGAPSHLPPSKSLSTMRAKDKIKGVTERFFFCMGLIYQVMKVRLELAADKSPTYPYDVSEKGRESSDLNECTLRIIRSKSSQSGVEFKAIVSQRGGLNIPLSTFHNLKINKRFGLPGNDTTYACQFLPEVKINRNTIQTLLRENISLERGIEIASDLFYIYKLRLMPDESMPPSPLELYEGLIELGYDWSKILLTRGRHNIDEHLNPVECYTTMDLIYILRGDKGFDFDCLKVSKSETKED